MDTAKCTITLCLVVLTRFNRQSLFFFLDNVHFQNSAQIAKALVNAQVDFQAMVNNRLFSFRKVVHNFINKLIWHLAVFLTTLFNWTCLKIWQLLVHLLFFINNFLIYSPKDLPALFFPCPLDASRIFLLSRITWRLLKRAREKNKNPASIWVFLIPSKRGRWKSWLGQNCHWLWQILSWIGLACHRQEVKQAQRV